MPLIAKGVYSRTSDYPYEVEATYQMKYFVNSTLITLDLIVETDKSLMSRYANYAEYYRYYTDHLFYLIGQVNDRLVAKKGRKDANVVTAKQEYIELNRNNYCFNESNFRILSDKMPRNIIEHLDERNLVRICESRGVGGFNVILSDSDQEMVSSIKQNRAFYPYTLDLVDGKVLFFDVQAQHDTSIQIDVDIEELRTELQKLKQNIEDFDSFLHE